MNAATPNVRFREARERLGLLAADIEAETGISCSCIWDIETHENELASCYSPEEIRRFCRVLQIRPIELFGTEISEPPVSAGDLVRMIYQEFSARDVTLEQFEDAVGWRLSACMEPPEKLLQDLSVDGLQWLCRELRIDWLRAM